MSLAFKDFPANTNGNDTVLNLFDEPIQPLAIQVLPSREDNGTIALRLQIQVGE